MKTSRNVILIIASLAAMLTLTRATTAHITPAETKVLAEEAYIYGLPLVMNSARSNTAGRPTQWFFNALSSAARILFSAPGATQFQTPRLPSFSATAFCVGI